MLGSTKTVEQRTQQKDSALLVPNDVHAQTLAEALGPEEEAPEIESKE